MTYLHLWNGRAAIVALAAIAVISVMIPAAPAHATDTWTTPFTGVQRLHRRTGNQNINALQVDLCAAGVSMRATNHTEGGRRTSSFGALVGAQAAINGDFFSGANTDGPAIHNGHQWSGNNHAYTGPVGFGRDRAGVQGHWETGSVAAWIREAVSGHPVVAWDGVVAEGFVNPHNTDPLCTNRHPRTAAGVSADGRRMWMVTVDGRRTGMAGMTCRELGELLVGLGAHTGVNLDGGGSTTMWVAGSGVVNYPSDGSERSVRNHLAVHASGAGEPANCPRFGAAYAGGGEAFHAGTTVTLEAGEEASVWMEFVNTGARTWTPARTRMGTTVPRDRSSPVRAADWIGPNRMAAVATNTPPGGRGRFHFTVRAPEQPGEYQEFFGLVEESVSWFGDSVGPADNVFFFRVISVEPQEPEPEPEPDVGIPDPDVGADPDVATTSDIGAASDIGPDTDLDAMPDDAPDAVAEHDLGLQDADDRSPPPSGNATATTSSCACTQPSGPPSSQGPLWALSILALFLIQSIRIRSHRCAP